MRRALLLVILTASAACGGSHDFTVDPLPPCPTCSVGHLRAAATAPRRATFAVDGGRVVAFGDQHLVWTDPDLGTVETGDTDIPVDDYVAGPFIIGATSSADGRAVVAVSGGLKSGFGTTTSLVGLDGGGSPTWHTTAVDASQPVPTWLYSSPDGTPIVLANTLSATLALGSQTYSGWMLFAKLSPSDGSVTAAKVHAATRANITATAIAPDGSAIFAGSIDGTVSFGGTAPDLSGNTAGQVMFVAKVDANGAGVWAKTLTSTGPAYVGSVATDGERVFVAGTYTTSIDVGGGNTLSSTDPTAQFLVALDGNGDHAWSVSLSSDIGLPSVATTPAGVLLSGSYFNAADVAGLPAPASTSEAGLVAEIVNGHAVWLLTATGAGAHSCESLGTIAGHTYVMLDAIDGTDPVHTDFDSVSIDGETHLVADVVTTPAS